MLDRSKVRFQTKTDTGVYDGRGSLPGRVCSSDVPVQISNGGTLEEDPASLKKVKLESVKGRGPITGQLSAI